MKTEKELDQAILDITMKINKSFPELVKYIKEIPVDVLEKNKKKSLEDYYNSLQELVKGYAIDHPKKDDLEGYPVHPAAEDVYNKWKEEAQLNPEDLSKHKAPNEKPGTRNEKDFSEDMSGDDLDIPGSELDNQQESVGSEDEENNYYSLGGDDHNDLEEDKS